MKASFAAVATALLAFSADASPVAKRAGVTDADVLQFALTLEHLENAFYKGAVSTMPLKTFTDAGFSPFFYDQLKYVTHDEEAHVQFLEAGLTAAGATPVVACQYKFPYTDAKSFVALASVIEGVGVSAYLGAAPAISSKAYLTAAGSILVTEAIHQSALRGGNKEIPMANPFGTPMGVNAIYSIAAQFITSCPGGSTNLTFASAYPTLTDFQALPAALGIPFTFTSSVDVPAGAYITYVGGLDVAAVPASVSGRQVTATIPTTYEAFAGQIYGFLTKDGSGNLTDSNILAGPAILEVTPNSPTFDLSIQ